MSIPRAELVSGLCGAAEAVQAHAPGVAQRFAQAA